MYKVLKLFFMVLVLVSYCEGGDDYYVANEGDIWVHDVSVKQIAQGQTYRNSFNITFEQIEPKTINGKEVDVMKSYTDKEFSGLLFSYKDNIGVHDYGKHEVEKVSPKIDDNLKYKYPLNIGSSWTKRLTTISVGENMDFSLPVQCYVVNTNEEVMVTAGQYKNCLKIKCKGTKSKYILPPPKGFKELLIYVEIDQYVWFAPEVGEVKEIYTEKVKSKSKVLYLGLKTENISLRYVSQLKSHTSTSTVNKVKNSVKNFFSKDDSQSLGSKPITKVTENEIKQKVFEALKNDSQISKDFIDTLQIKYTNSILALYNNCPELVKLNDEKLSKEYKKKEKARKGDVWGNLFAVGMGDNFWDKTVKFRDECRQMRYVASNLSQMIEGVKEVKLWDTAPNVSKSRELSKAIELEDGRKVQESLHKKGCSKNNIDECVSLGAKYENGKGVKKDYAKARELYKKACDWGNAKGCHNLGGSYLIGKGIKRNNKKSVQLYEKSCDGSYGQGCFMLGSLYEAGTRVEQDYAKARNLYKKAANLGDARGYFKLGVMYAEGKGVRQDYFKASELYKKSCNVGWASVCVKLGELYESGKGVKKDYAKAKKLYEKACNMKYASGCEKLENISNRDASPSEDIIKSTETNEKTSSLTTTNKNPKKIDLSNSSMDISLIYKEIGNYIQFDVKSTNTGSDAKGGVSISFPTLKHKNFSVGNDGFSSVDVYTSGSKLWNRKQKKQIVSDYLLVEGWSKEWKSGESKAMQFLIDKSKINHQSFNIRGIMIQGKKEFTLPKFGDEDQQGYPVKTIVIDSSQMEQVSTNSKNQLQNTNTSDNVTNISTRRGNDVKITNFSHPEDEPKGLYIVELEANNQSKTYRLYCPKKVVRDITNNTYGKSRSIQDEDSVTFAGNKVLRKAYDKICPSFPKPQSTTQNTSVPVIVRRTSIGSVQGISRNGDGFIAIRSGPGGKHKMIDKLYRNGEKVIIADKKGKWKGLVYGNANCGTDLSKQKGKAYKGACKTGWVFGKYVKEGKVKKKPKKRKKNAKLGKRLYKKCAGCHGTTGRGRPLGKRVRLAGQSRQQIKNKLIAYKRGKRNKTGFGSMMQGQASNLNNTKINALADYIATFR